MSGISFKTGGAARKPLSALRKIPFGEDSEVGNIEKPVVVTSLDPDAPEEQKEHKEQLVITPEPNRIWYGNKEEEQTSKKSSLVYGINKFASSTIKSKSKLEDNEDKAYAEDASTRPDAPDLKAYERVPVSDFGEAMLRGMGWNPKDGDTSTDAAHKPRAHLLGLGAKSGGTAEEQGVWGKGTQRQTREEKSYVPLKKVSKFSESGRSVPPSSDLRAKSQKSHRDTKRHVHKPYDRPPKT